MLPLRDSWLSLDDIARHWANELSPRMCKSEILDRLLSAFWRGELVATFNPLLDVSEQRSKALQVAAGMAEHPGLLFTPEGEEPCPETIDLPNGSTLVDVRSRVVWPPAAGSGSGLVAETAFQTLANVLVIAFAPDFRSCVTTMTVEQGDFGAFCKAGNYAAPKFWFAGAATISHAAAESRCRRWLRELAKQDSTPAPKADLRAQALNQFPGLSGRGFERAWSAEVPAAWRAPGARNKQALDQAGNRGNPCTPR